MNLRIRDGGLATLGIAALAAYVLACASFSPDDSKVLYPAFDPKTGASAMNLYDRQTKTSSQVFVLPSDAKAQDGPAMRPQWTPDGKYMVAAWPNPSDDDQLNLLLLPAGGKGTTRFHQVAEMEDAGQRLVGPLAIAGPFFFACVRSNEVLRLDLATGSTKTNAYQGELTLYPGPRGDSIYYVGKGTSREDVMEVGRLDLDKLVVMPIASIPESDMEEGGAVAFGRNGSDIAILLGNEPKDGLLIRHGNGWQRRELPSFPGEEMRYGFPEWSADGRLLFAPYCTAVADQTGTTFGLAEIPIDGSAVRRTPILKSTAGSSDNSDIWTFPIGLSNDGKTIGVSSTYLVYSDQLKLQPDAVALYFVDVSSAARKVSKVPIPLPRGFLE